MEAEFLCVVIGSREKKSIVKPTAMDFMDLRDEIFVTINLQIIQHPTDDSGFITLKSLVTYSSLYALICDNYTSMVLIDSSFRVYFYA